MIGCRRRPRPAGGMAGGREVASALQAVDAGSIFWGSSCRAERNPFFPLFPLLSSATGNLVRQEYLATTELADGLALALCRVSSGALGGRMRGGGRYCHGDSALGLLRSEEEVSCMAKWPGRPLARHQLLLCCFLFESGPINQ